MPHKNSYVKLESNLYLPCIRVVFLPFNSLDKLRPMYFKSPKYVPVESMPSTSCSCFFHSLRVHLLVNTWKNLKTKLPVERFNYHVVQGTIEPIMHLMNCLVILDALARKRIDCAQLAVVPRDDCLAASFASAKGDCLTGSSSEISEYDSE